MTDPKAIRERLTAELKGIEIDFAFGSPHQLNDEEAQGLAGLLVPAVVELLTSATAAKDREIERLKDIVIPHARKQEHADGFQVGWHSVLRRLKDGGSLEELSSVIPNPLPRRAELEAEAAALQQELETAIERYESAEAKAIALEQERDYWRDQEAVAIGERDDWRLRAQEILRDLTQVRQERDDVRHFVERWCAIRNVSPEDTAAALRGDFAKLEACAPYLKDGETPAECIERWRKDADATLTLLTKARQERDALTETLNEVIEARDGLRAERDALKAQLDGARELAAELKADIDAQVQASRDALRQSSGQPQSSPPREDPGKVGGRRAGTPHSHDYEHGMRCRGCGHFLADPQSSGQPGPEPKYVGDDLCAQGDHYFQDGRCTACGQPEYCRGVHRVYVNGKCAHCGAPAPGEQET